MRKFIAVITLILGLLLTATAYADPTTDEGTVTPLTGQTIETGDAYTGAVTASAVPFRQVRWFSGTGYAGGGICIANYTGWSTWQDRLTTAAREWSRAGGFYAWVASQGASCGTPLHYQLRVYRSHDTRYSTCVFWSGQKSYSANLPGYYWNTYINSWFVTQHCGIDPYSSVIQAKQASRLIGETLGCAVFHGGSYYSVMNLDRPDIAWPTANDRDCADRRYGFA